MEKAITTPYYSFFSFSEKKSTLALREAERQRGKGISRGKVTFEQRIFRTLLV